MYLSKWSEWRRYLQLFSLLNDLIYKISTTNNSLAQIYLNVSENMLFYGKILIEVNNYETFSLFE